MAAKKLFTNARYMTRGVASTLNPMLIALLWELVDNLPDERDYLQVFDLSPVADSQKIVHRAEEPAHIEEYAVPLKNLAADEAVIDKVYIIDDGEHSTMLLADEY